MKAVLFYNQSKVFANEMWGSAILVCILSLALHPEIFAQSVGNIKLNQLGFYPNTVENAIETVQVKLKPNP